MFNFYSSIIKCSFDSSVPGSLTLSPVKRAYAKRKIVSVPELLSVRAELAGQTEPMKVESNDEQPFDEFLILNNKPDSNETNDFVKSEANAIEIASAPSGECIAENTSTISYSIPQSSVLVLTSAGNYMIFGNDIAKKPIQLKVEQPQVEQVIILNSNDIQFGEMNVDCSQQVEPVIDDKK